MPNCTLSIFQFNFGFKPSVTFSLNNNSYLCGSSLSITLTVTFFTATITGKRRFHFFAFCDCDIIFTMNHLG